MRAAIFLLMMSLAACSKQPVGEAESESAIAERAGDIRNDADAEVNRQIAEIDAAANAEMAELGTEPVNAQ